eukprot:6197607-Pleurochrysis_carterae.AAC.1
MSREAELAQLVQLNGAYRVKREEAQNRETVIVCDRPQAVKAASGREGSSRQDGEPARREGSVASHDQLARTHKRTEMSRRSRAVSERGARLAKLVVRHALMGTVGKDKDALATPRNAKPDELPAPNARTYARRPGMDTAFLALSP